MLWLDSTGGYGYRRVTEFLHEAAWRVKVVQKWLASVGVQTLYITLGSPWEDGHCESFNGSLRDELLGGEVFYSLEEAKILIDAWRQHCNPIRLHSFLGYRPSEPEAAAAGAMMN